MAEEEKKETIIRKKVDESWKEDVKKEKKKVKETKEEPDEGRMPEGDFRSFITGLVMQALMFMGEIPDPASKQKRKNLPQARYMIDILMMLREKTRGNLSEEEGGLLEGAVHEMQMKYVKAAEQV